MRGCGIFARASDHAKQHHAGRRIRSGNGHRNRLG
jgi:hypothetical protein